MTLIGRIADDDYAHQLIHSFQKDHIDTSQLMVDTDAKTGVAFVWVDMEGHNKCVCSLGAVSYTHLGRSVFSAFLTFLLVYSVNAAVSASASRPLKKIRYLGGELLRSFFTA